MAVTSWVFPRPFDSPKLGIPFVEANIPLVKSSELLVGAERAVEGEKKVVNSC